MSGINVANTAIDYARKHNATRIIIGKTLRPRWQEFVFGSVVDQLIHHSGTIDVYVISSQEKTQEKPVTMEPLLPATPPKDYVASLAIVAGITILGWLIHSFISPVNLAMLYVLGVVGDLSGREKERGAAGRHQEVHLVLLDHLGGFLHAHARVRLVVDDRLQLSTEHTAGRVDLLDRQLGCTGPRICRCSTDP